MVLHDKKHSGWENTREFCIYRIKSAGILFLFPNRFIDSSINYVLGGVCVVFFVEILDPLVMPIPNRVFVSV